MSRAPKDQFIDGVAPSIARKRSIRTLNMITGKLKPLDEILSSLEHYKNILILACGSCVTVCLAGGDREAHALARDLSTPGSAGCSERSIHVRTIQRQCETDLLKAFLEIPPDTDILLSLACGAGVQTLAETFGHLPVIPALNTTFLGALDEQGIWREKCQGCRGLRSDLHSRHMSDNAMRQAITEWALRGSFER